MVYACSLEKVCGEIRQSVEDIREGHKVQASWKVDAKKQVLKGKVVGYVDDDDGVKLTIKWNKDGATTSHMVLAWMVWSHLRS